MENHFQPPKSDLVNLANDENTSGLGKEHPLPDGVAGWSWGAFCFNWIWALFNRTWIGLLAFLPYIGFIMIFVLGFKGREWAWRNKRWDSIEHFQKVQRRWSIIGLVFFFVFVVGILAAIAIPAYHEYTLRAAG